MSTPRNKPIRRRRTAKPIGLAAPLVLGIDIGRSTLSLALGEVGPNGETRILETSYERHHGRPQDLLAPALARIGAARIGRAAATGVLGDQIPPPVSAGIPEEVCQEEAVKHFFGLAGPVNVVRMAARGYSVLTRNAEGRFTHTENEKCSSGTGETMERIIARFGVGLEEAIVLAERADEAIPITARCSVFAKSEMTHYANQGHPTPRLFRGYFESLGRNVHGLFSRCRVEGPIHLVGGVAEVAPIVRAFVELAGDGARVHPSATVFEAVGAMCIAAHELFREGPAPLPADLAGLWRGKRHAVRPLDPAPVAAARAIRLREPPLPESAPEPRDPLVLGLDLGSTGSKAVLWSPRLGRAVLDAYDRTDGNPVEAAQRLIRRIRERGEPNIRAVGVTGSGREAVATVLAAAYPGLDGHIHVENEIVAHATAAAALDPDRGRSLSIVEIGGQDAKFVNVEGGRIVESDMNKACSAGTGSFLEEQAILYGVEDIERFGRMAGEARRPPDLGQMCTVFIADLAGEALSEGYSTEDIFAGFQHSVIQNYLNRVMGNRRFLDRIFFQGKPATSASLARTLAAVTGREVVVPPNPGAMGAIGIAMLAARASGEKALGRASSLDLDAFERARLAGRTEFRCRDPRCGNLCRIERAAVQIGETTHPVLSGGACPKYEVGAAGARKLPREAPNAFRERAELLRPFIENADPNDGEPREAPQLGIPYSHFLIDTLPFFVTFFRKLGWRTRVLKSTPDSLARGDALCPSYDACAPTKILHALVDADMDALFVPKFLRLPSRGGSSASSTCPMAQAAPELAEAALTRSGRAAAVRVLRPRLLLNEAGLAAPEVLGSLATLGVDLDGQGASGLAEAYEAALTAQGAFEHAMEHAGRRVLAFAEAHDLPVVVVLGNSHVVHETLLDAGVPEVVPRNGALALPIEALPIPREVPPLERVYWGPGNRWLRAALAASLSRGRVFPLLVVTYGCGPASCIEHLFHDLMEGYPHTVIETDGHGGTAGFVTRVQTFLHAVRSFAGDERARNAPPAGWKKAAPYDRMEEPTREEMRGSRVLVFPLGDAFAPMFAAACRSLGMSKAEPAASSGPSALTLGRKDCSGKECLPYQMIWGAYREKLAPESGNNNGNGHGGRVEPTVLLQIAGRAACRNGMFPVLNELALRRLGMDNHVSVKRLGIDLGAPLALKLWIGMVATDLLTDMRYYLRPDERRPGEVDQIFGRALQQIVALLERTEDPNPARWLAEIARLYGIGDVLESAAREYAEIRREAEGRKNRELRTVLVAGDIYLRLDSGSNDDLVRRLNAQGLRVLVEPASELVEYLVRNRSTELMEFTGGILKNRVFRLAMGMAIDRLHARASVHHPWLPRLDPEAIRHASLALMDGHPFGEAPMTIGAATHAFDSRATDGVVVIGPMGCGPALISESLLRQRLDIPWLFLYADGTPIPERRIAAYAWKLKRLPARTRAEHDPA